MGSITKRPTGYQAQTCSNGIRRTKTFKKLADAKRWIAQVESDFSVGLVPEAHNHVSDHLITYREEVTMRRGHTRHESAVIGCFLEDPISSIPIHSVTSKDVEAWIERRRTIPSRRTGRLVEESTIARQLQTLSAFFSWAVKRQLIAKNPCHGIERPQENEHRERIASDEEIEAIKLVAGWEEGTPPVTKTQRVAAAFILACCTGMRAGEMMRIERTWIHGRTLKIPAEAAKTRTTRTIALNDRSMDILKSVMSLGFEPHIFDMSAGIRDALWRKIRDKAGLQEVRDSEGRLIKQGLNFHDGRATFCTWAASPGPDGAPRLDVMSLARQTGHKNLKMLMRYYRPSVESFVDRLNK